MYIQHIRIHNIRSIYHLDWMIIDEQALPGWHVLLGENGSGKTTFLRAVALALVGPTNAYALRQNWTDWLTHGQNTGEIELTLKADQKLDKFASKGRRGGKPLKALIRLHRDGATTELKSETQKSSLAPDRHIWGTGEGWFSAAYGPYRRFAGGNKDTEKIYYSSPKLGAHLSIFGEDVALTESVGWLKDLNYKQLEGKPEGAILEPLKRLINQPGFLPHSTRLQKITSDGVSFVDGNDNPVLVENLSDGYRSILSMTFELIRQLQRVYPEEQIFSSEESSKILVPGVVLIDEVDAHLHPTWQRQIGLWFRKHFPNIQFLVTTHSPLICQAADVGTVWKLPAPGSDETCKRVTGQDLERLLYGNILEAYSTDLFGNTISRSEKAQKWMQRLAELNQKELSQPLTSQELEEQRELRGRLPLHTNTIGF